MRDGDAGLASEGRYLRDQVGVRLVAQQHAQTGRVSAVRRFHEGSEPELVVVGRRTVLIKVLTSTSTYPKIKGANERKRT